MLSWTLLLAVAVAGLIAWFWHNSLKARERANVAAQDACERAGLQFLDGTVAFSEMRFAREHGRLGLRRTYVFDYAARSIERQQGFIVLHGARVETVGFATPTQNATAEPRLTSVHNHEHGTPRPNNVLDLEEWRRQRQRTGSHDELRRSEPGERRW